MTILSICTNALNEIGGFAVPGSFYGSTDLTAKLALALLRREGTNLATNHKWASLITTATITTVASDDTYALPSDFRAFHNMTAWDRTNSWPLGGPASPAQWQVFKSSSVADTTIFRWFRVDGTNVRIHPVPSTNGDTIVYEYQSKNWIVLQSSGATAAEIASDSDTTLLDEELLTLGLKWRFLQAKGMPFEAEFLEHQALVERRRADDGGRHIIDLGPQGGGLGMLQLPDTGFGS